MRASTSTCEVSKAMPQYRVSWTVILGGYRAVIRRLVFLLAVALVAAASAGAHGPATAIGRAVEALSQGAVSYDPLAAASDVEAAGFEALGGDGVAIAFLPEAALTEVPGGPQAVVAEIAREAALDGSLVALVGTQLAAVSDSIDPARLATLVRAAEGSQGSPAARLEVLTRAVRAEQPRDKGGALWNWIAALGGVALVGAAVLLRNRTGRV
jgi:hypothetical protein